MMVAMTTRPLKSGFASLHVHQTWRSGIVITGSNTRQEKEGENDGVQKRGSANEARHPFPIQALSYYQRTTLRLPPARCRQPKLLLSRYPRNLPLPIVARGRILCQGFFEAAFCLVFPAILGIPSFHVTHNKGAFAATRWAKGQNSAPVISRLPLMRTPKSSPASKLDNGTCQLGATCLALVQTACHHNNNLHN